MVKSTIRDNAFLIKLSNQNMVFVKTHMACKNVTNAIFSHTRKARLELVFKDNFCQPHLDVFTKCKWHVQVITRDKAFLYHECYVLRCYFKHS